MANTTRIAREAKHFLDKTPQKERFNEALIALQETPFPRGVEKLGGYRYRVRVGGYRIVYTFEQNQIIVLYIRRRENAY